MIMIKLGGIKKPRVPAPGQRADGKSAVISPREQLIQVDATDRKHRRSRGTADRRKERAPDHIRMQKATSKTDHPGCQAVEEPARQAGSVKDFSHQDEKRQGQQAGRCRDVPVALSQDPIRPASRGKRTGG